MQGLYLLPSNTHSGVSSSTLLLPERVLSIQFEVLILCFYKGLHGGGRGWLTSHAHTFTLIHLEPQWMWDKRVSLPFHAAVKLSCWDMQTRQSFDFETSKQPLLDLLSVEHGKVLQSSLFPLVIHPVLFGFRVEWCDMYGHDSSCLLDDIIQPGLALRAIWLYKCALNILLYFLLFCIKHFKIIP